MAVFSPWPAMALKLLFLDETELRWHELCSPAAPRGNNWKQAYVM